MRLVEALSLSLHEWGPLVYQEAMEEILGLHSATGQSGAL